MLSKPIILVVIIVLLLVFYFVISLSASKGKKENEKISKYLFGVRVLIIILGCVGTLIWFFSK